MGLFDDWSWGASLTAGVDEVGRGPLAGPVLAGAVILNPGHHIVGLKDSKRLTAKQRESLAEEIRMRSLAFAVGRAEVEEIDRLNILRASHLAMQRAVQGLAVAPNVIFVDGNLLPSFPFPAVAVVKGDVTVPEISAGAIIAKTMRDAEMRRMAETYPGYGFEAHKGYATKAHLEALRELGPSPIHRLSFAPVRTHEPRSEALPL